MPQDGYGRHVAAFPTASAISKEAILISSTFMDGAVLFDFGIRYALVLLW